MRLGPWPTQALNRKVSDDDAVEIILHCKTHADVVAFAKRLGVAEKTVRQIRAGRYFAKARERAKRLAAQQASES